MTNRGANLVKRTLSSHDSGKVVAARLPLFELPELDAARQERAELMRKLAIGGLEIRSRIRIEQKLKLLVAKIMRLEMQLRGGA